MLAVLQHSMNGMSDGGTDLRNMLDELLTRKMSELGPNLRAEVRKELRLHFDSQAPDVEEADTYHPSEVPHHTDLRAFSKGSSSTPGKQEVPGCPATPSASPPKWAEPVFSASQDRTPLQLPMQERVRSASKTKSFETGMAVVPSVSRPSVSTPRTAPRKHGSFNGRGLVGMATDTQRWLPELTRNNSSRSLHDVFHRLVTDVKFDWCICALIVANALFLGCQTDFMARQGTDMLPEVFSVTESLFCAFFAMELSIKLFVFRWKYFTMDDRNWNIFDMFVVILQLTEEVLAIFGSSVFSQNLSFTRMLKLLRLVRIIRLARILRMIHELRVLVSCITNSIKSLVWTCLLLFIMIYSMSLILTQLVHDHRMTFDPEGLCNSGREGCEHHLALLHFYGNLARSMLSLFQSISGGVDWDQLLYPLLTEISPLLGALFCLYIMFAVLAMMNVVTGIFVDSVLVSAKQDKDQFLLNNAREIFRDADNGNFTEEQFLSMLGNRHMVEFFKGIDVDPSYASTLFKIMDLDESGEINAEEFLSSCIKLRGPAKALDTAVLIRNMQQIQGRFRDLELPIKDHNLRNASYTTSSPQSPRSPTSPRGAG